MALANYEGMAFRDGHHWHEGCDPILPSPGDKPSHTPHAAVGLNTLRVGVHKTTPILYIWDEQQQGWLAERLEGNLYPNVPGEPYASVVAIGIDAPLGGPGIAILIDENETVWTAVGAYEAFESWCEEYGGL